MSFEREDASEHAAVDSWSFVWAACLLFALTAFPGWYFYVLAEPLRPIVLIELAQLVVALLILIRPRGLTGLVVLALLQLAQAGWWLPELPNNRWVTSLLHLAFLAALLHRPREFRFGDFQIPARAIVVICYGFAFFAKLNVDYLDPAVSCASRFYGNVAGWLPLPTAPWAEHTAIWGALIVEGFLAAALALTRGRWRILTVVIGLAFHLALSFDLGKHFVNFSAVMSAGLLLFLPQQDLEELAPVRPGWRDPRRWFAVGLLVLTATGFAAAAKLLPGASFFIVRNAVWTAFAVLLIHRVGRLLLRPEPWDQVWRKVAFGPACVVGLALLNGSSPYLGLKTRTAFDMYSNLRLEADRSNHQIVPWSLDLLGVLDDEVSVIAVDDPQLRRVLEPGSRWPWFEFSRRVGEAPRARIVYERRGKRWVHHPGGRSPILAPPWLLRKFLIFRPLGTASRGECLW